MKARAVKGTHVSGVLVNLFRQPQPGREAQRLEHRQLRGVDVVLLHVTGDTGKRLLDFRVTAHSYVALNITACT